jgi:rhodanese-related sulfurtransferase
MQSAPDTITAGARRTLTAIVLAAASALVAAAAPAATNVASRGAGSAIVAAIDAPGLRQRMQKEPGLVVVDVRAAPFFEDCHVAGATNVPLRQVEAATGDWPRDRAIVVYCQDRDCEDSAKAALLLARAGFGRVQHFAGGIREWRAGKFPTIGPAQLLDD